MGVGASGNDGAVLATALIDNVSVQQVLPAVNVVATGSPACKQGTVAGQYTITRSGDSMTWPLTVFYTMTGTATMGTDYLALSGSVVIPAGVASATVTLTPISGAPPVGNRTATLTLTSNSAYTAGAASSANVLIYDTPLNLWKVANFTQAQLNNPSVSGPAATPANDGVPVLIKYALNLPLFSQGCSGLPVLTCSNSTPTLTFQQPTSTTDITYIPEVSIDLLHWYSGSEYVSVTGTSSGGNTQTVTATSRFPMISNPRQFMRLRVTMP